MFALYFLQPGHGAAGIWYLTGHYGSRAMLNRAVKWRRAAHADYGITTELCALPGRGLGTTVQRADMPAGIRLPS
jgi:hypothetical protein